MIFHLVTEDAFVELSILHEKAEAALKCIIGNSKCQHAQTLAEIAGDYLSAMDEMVRTIQKNRFRAPPC